MAEIQIKKWRLENKEAEMQIKKWRLDSEEASQGSTSTQQLMERPNLLGNGKKIARKSPNNTGGSIARKSPNYQVNNDIFAGVAESRSPSVTPGRSNPGTPPIKITPDSQEAGKGKGKNRKNVEIISKRSRKSVPKRNPGLNALKEIKHYQQTTNLLIPKLAFQNLVKEITTNYRNDLRIQSPALGILHHASESYLIETLEMANLCCLHAKRVTIMNKDIRLAKRIIEKD